jgi:hypothetical protein
LPKQRQAVDECANYLLTDRDLLKYDQHLAQGLAIATGVIEGACRHLVKDRMDLTGARKVMVLDRLFPPTHEHAYRRWGGIEGSDTVFFDNIPPPINSWIIWGALINDNGRPVRKRPIDG